MTNIALNTHCMKNASGNKDQMWQKLKTVRCKFLSLSKRIDEDIKAEKVMRKLFPGTRKDMEQLNKLALEIMKLKEKVHIISANPPPDDAHCHQEVEPDMEDESNHDQMKHAIANAG